jgi:hypothetical protein
MSGVPAEIRILSYQLGKEIAISAQSTPVREVLGLNLNRIIDYFV